MITTREERVTAGRGANKLPLLDISGDAVFFIKQGVEVQTSIYERVNGLKQSLQSTMDLLNSLVDTKENAVTLLTVLLHTDESDMNEHGRQVYALSSHANELIHEIENLSRISKNLQGDCLYKISAEDAKRYGL